MSDSLQPQGLPWVWFLGWKDPLGREWCSVTQMCPTLQPNGLQLTRFHYLSPSPRACSHSCTLNKWYHPTILSIVISFSCLQSFPASGSFLMSQHFASGGQGVGASASASALPVTIQGWSPQLLKTPLDWRGLDLPAVCAPVLQEEGS